MRTELIHRDLNQELIKMMGLYPIVTLIGPRQSGKSTLVKMAYPQFAYVSLEDPDTRQFAEADPRAFLEQFHSGVILDEIQRLPSLLSYLQGYVDKDDRPGQFVLTGSHQLALHEAITQSLAGRTAMLKLLPLSMHELSSLNTDFSLNDYLFQGMYPRVYRQGIPPTVFYRDYVQTYLERDVRQLLQVKDLTQFQQFLHWIAGNCGQVINYENAGKAIGINANTAKSWLSVLEASFILFRLPPYFENFGKRITKSPKIYFYDTGLVTYLLGIKSPDQLIHHPQKGALFENLVISEVLKSYYHRGVEPMIYYYRDSNQNEVDLLLQQANQFIAIEIKSSQTFHHSFTKGIKYFEQLVDGRLKSAFVIYAGDKEQSIGHVNVVNYARMLSCQEPFN